MNGNYQQDPSALMALVRSNPNLMNMVDQVARLSQLTAVAQQAAPVMSQFAQNPLQAMNNLGNWAQNTQNQVANQQQQNQGVQPQQNQIPQQQMADPNQQQQGGQPPMNAMSMAMEIVAEFRQSFQVLNNNLKEIHDMIEKQNNKLDATLDRMDAAITRIVGAEVSNAEDPGGKNAGASKANKS